MILHTTHPVKKPRARLSTRPYSTLTHSLPLIPPIPPWIAIAAPESPAIRLWLSLVGIPNTDAATLYTTIDTSAAQSAISASWVLFPKSTMLLIVDATELLI